MLQKEKWEKEEKEMYREQRTYLWVKAKRKASVRNKKQAQLKEQLAKV